MYGLCVTGEHEYRYVGQTIGSLQDRLRKHVLRAMSGRDLYPVHQWIHRHSGAVSADVLAITTDRDHLDFLESYWIATLRWHGRLLNVTHGGVTNRGRSPSKEERAWRSIRYSGQGNPMFGKTGSMAPGYGRTGALHPMFGKHHSNEAKMKISKSVTGKRHSEETRQLMRESQARRDKNAVSLSGKKAMHVRWHVNRGTTNPTCVFCVD